MAEATMTRRGQLTLPDEVRKALRLRPGDQVRVIVRGRGRAEMVTERSEAARPSRSLFGRPARSVSIEEVNAGLSARGKAT